MIRGAHRHTHGSSKLHFMQVTVSDNDIVDELPVFGPGIHPKSLVHVTELEGVCHGNLEQSNQ